MPSNSRSSFLLPALAFALGAGVLMWIAAGYVTGNLPAFTVTVLIAACYGVGGVELLRYRRATGGLHAALSALPDADTALERWLEQLDVGLRAPVRLRIQGERVGLPLPALTPYLVGMLVLLGMFGTLLGMTVMLRGTGIALETATDLQAIRDSLAAPVKGLGFAFGTSIAGVAASAMLGLASALVRRDRQHAVQRLDAACAGALHIHSQAHQRAETLRLLQAQSGVMPALVDRLKTMVDAIEQQAVAADTRQDTRQADFHARAEAAYTQLADSVERSLHSSVADGARAAAAALQPVFETTMAALSRETAALQGSVREAVDHQLQAVSSGLDSATRSIAGHWQQAIDAQATSNAALAGELRATLEGFNARFEQRSQQLLDNVVARLDDSTARADALHTRIDSAVDRQLQALNSGFETSTAAIAERWQQALDAQAATNSALTGDLRTTLEGFNTHFEQRSQGVLDTVIARLEDSATRADALHTRIENAVDRQLQALNSGFETSTEAVARRWQQALEVQQAAHAALVADLQQALDGVGTTFEARTSALVDGIGARMDTSVTGLREAWAEALAHQRAEQAAMTDQQRQALEAATAAFAGQSAALMQQLDSAHAALAEALAAQDAQRLTAWTGSLEALAAALREEWNRSSAETTRQQQAICDTLADTAETITARTRDHAGETIAEISRLMDTAAAAPRAAAEVIAELRQSLSESMVRDTAMLEERTQMLATLETLLGAVNHASTEQRTAIDALVSTSAELLERVGNRFTDHISQETGKLDGIADELRAGAAEVASLGEAFAAAVGVFGESNDALAARLQSIEQALEQSLGRSDEQLAYYVAQAREVVDLSVLAQKQIIEELQALGSRQAASA